MLLRTATGVALATLAAPAWASDVPLYQPAPSWVIPAPPIDPARLDGDAPVVLILDTQQRLENGRVWNYVDTATRAASAQMLGEIGTVAIPWLPDKGDLIVHRVEIVRGTERIDLLKQGERFSVLRREEGLERRELNGALTATMAVQGLRVGDVLRVSLSVTQADPALKGRVQSILPVMADPFRAGFARARVSWPATSDIKWKMFADGPTPTPKLVDGFRELTVTMPLAKQPEIPGDAPGRYQRPPMLEASSFADWSDVSRTMAPLFATDGLIAPGGALAGEVATIAAASADPLARAGRALELVQDKIRYLAMGMNGGNYVPETPARTWALRYGDCKAKTLLLLAMLRSLGIEAEAVVASSQAGDFVGARLPMPAAFDHVLVRASIAGRSLWLDGTGTGARQADIADTPALRYVLPLRAEGAALMPVPLHADARPWLDVSLDLDQSAGIDFPSLFQTTITVRGQPGAMMAAGLAQAGAEQKRDMIAQIVGQYVQPGQIGESTVRYDAPTGTAVVTASGLFTTGWYREEKRTRQSLDRAVGMIGFEPDRARAAWRDIPVMTQGPSSMNYRTRIRLPDGGRGYTLEGDRTLGGTLGGMAVRRTTTLADGVVTVTDRIDAVGAEIASADIAAERARMAQARTRLIALIAPTDAPKRWQTPSTGRADPRFKAIEASFAKAIAADPDEVTGHESRASFRAGIFDRRGAIEDLGRAIAIEPSVTFYLRRSELHAALGDTAAALGDAEAARTLDPSSDAALRQLASIHADSGDRKRALALIQERIDQGGKDRFGYLGTKASLQADDGDVTAAIATLDAAIAEKPGDAALLNERCWVKGTRNVALDTALRDCTRAIELSDNPAAPLDSRAMVYFRLNRPDDALADLDASLEESPSQAASLYLRGVIRKAGGKPSEAATDLATARLLAPQIDRTYQRYGITP